MFRCRLRSVCAEACSPRSSPRSVPPAVRGKFSLHQAYSTPTPTKCLLAAYTKLTEYATRDTPQLAPSAGVFGTSCVANLFKLPRTLVASWYAKLMPSLLHTYTHRSCHELFAPSGRKLATSIHLTCFRASSTCAINLRNVCALTDAKLPSLRHTYARNISLKLLMPSLRQACANPTPIN
jgi:hypothetical protein